MLISHLTQILLMLLCHLVDVLAPSIRKFLTFDPPSGDFLGLRDIFCTTGKDILSKSMKAILVSARALLEQIY